MLLKANFKTIQHSISVSFVVCAISRRNYPALILIEDAIETPRLIL